MHYKEINGVRYFDVARKNDLTENGNFKVSNVMLLVFGFLVLGLVLVWAGMNGVTLQ